MASILRQIVAGPRARHPEAGLDLCYVTDHIIATSGPSQTYPQRAYRNPLDQLVSFLDSKHDGNWAIWEFRAEGTGYPDDAVYGRIRHYPWPDHHPPPFRLIPNIMASMRNWLHGGDLDGGGVVPGGSPPTLAGRISSRASSALGRRQSGASANRRVAVVHCKAGKGRSGTVACSYLISEEGWKAEEALARFTQRRMRPKFGAGVSIPSQLRWVSYVDRWTRNGKKYVDRPIEVLEVHVWGLRNGVKVDVEGFVEDGRKIQAFHTFSRSERIVVEGDAPAGGGLSAMVWEMAGYPPIPGDKVPKDVELADGANAEASSTAPEGPDGAPAAQEDRHTLQHKSVALIQDVTQGVRPGLDKLKPKTIAGSAAASRSNTPTLPVSPPDDPGEAEPGGRAVILKPSEPILIPHSDINISVERRSKMSKSMGLTMVSAVALVWFNAFFDGRGPEQDGHPDDSGVFAIEWDAMDGIKGSSRKGARALDRLAVVWRAAGTAGQAAEESIPEPAEGQPVPQLPPADWKGAARPLEEKDLGLRKPSPAIPEASSGSSLRSADNVLKGGDAGVEDQASDGTSMKGVRTSGPAGDELLTEGATERKQ